MIPPQYLGYIVFPAPAGINRISKQNRNRRWSVPRASGDKPRLISLVWLAAQCSPRQRG